MKKLISKYVVEDKAISNEVKARLYEGQCFGMAAIVIAERMRLNIYCKSSCARYESIRKPLWDSYDGCNEVDGKKYHGKKSYLNKEKS